MVYESSYESGRQPYKPDLQRGKWEKPTDFIFACCGLSLKLDFFLVSSWFFFNMGLFGMLPYYIYMVVYLVPILVVHCFMGQFSSSGFLSAFRLSPFFKGMGYVSLVLSAASLLYYAIFAIIPILFILNSLRPTLPWSCEAVKSISNETFVCNDADSDYISELEHTNMTLIYDSSINHIPSVYYFHSHFESSLNNVLYYEEEGLELSWAIFGYTIIMWAMVAAIFYKFSETAKFGKLMRYMVSITLGLLILCFVRFLFLPGALDGLLHYVRPHYEHMILGGVSMTVVVLQAFGSGWGTVMALSSYNKFNTNVMSYSWIIAFGQTLVYILFGMVSNMIHGFFSEMSIHSYDLYVEQNWILYLTSASVLATMELPHMWTIIYYTMLLMTSLIVIITQLFTIFTSLFDEFELLRHYRQEVIFGVIGLLTPISLFFGTNHGIIYFAALSENCVFIYSVMHLLLLLVVLWVYGRERFQRDFQFMLGAPFASWKIFILRYLAPIFLMLSMLIGLTMTYTTLSRSSTVVEIISVLVVIVPLTFIPGYGIYITIQNTGSFGARFRRAFRPNDWYPLEKEDRQKYEEIVGNSDVTHQLHEITEEVN